jgi:hypothetical protein
METIKKIAEKYKAWSMENPVKSIFLTGFVLGFIVGAVLC